MYIYTNYFCDAMRNYLPRTKALDKYTCTKPTKTGAIGQHSEPYLFLTLAWQVSVAWWWTGNTLGNNRCYPLSVHMNRCAKFPQSTRYMSHVSVESCCLYNKQRATVFDLQSNLDHHIPSFCPAGLSISSQPRDIVVVYGQEARLEVKIERSQYPAKFQWFKNGHQLSGKTDSSW